MNNRSAWAEVDLGAIAANAKVLAGLASPAALCAVVKADGYGHGAVTVARTALDAGATWLAVALTSEGAQLRDAGIRAPILLLSEPPVDEHRDVVAFDLTPTVYTDEGIESLAHRATRPLHVHLKVDTGMHRVGVAPGDAVAMAKSIVAQKQLVLGGVWTHFAVADEPGHAATAEQRASFDAVLAELRAAGIEPALVHAANSAATIDHPELRHGMVRTGIALYGLDPSPGGTLAYHRLRCGDWWDEDPSSPTYNRFRHVACGTTPPFGGGSEALWRESVAYREFAEIRYNAAPVVGGRGSAIFLHDDTGRATNGCVSLSRARLVPLLRRLRPGARILIRTA